MSIRQNPETNMWILEWRDCDDRQHRHKGFRSLEAVYARMSELGLDIRRVIRRAPNSPEHRAAVSRSMKGKRHSAERRAAIGAGVRRALTGTRKSSEHRAALSASLKGRTFSAGTIARMKAAQSGHSLPEHIQEIVREIAREVYLPGETP
jgi:hypothetical protein